MTAPTLSTAWQQALQTRAQNTNPCQRQYHNCTHTSDQLNPTAPQQQLQAAHRDDTYYDAWLSVCNSCANIDTAMNANTNPADSALIALLNVPTTLVTNFLNQVHNFGTTYLPGPTAYITNAISVLQGLL